ncbi:unnamed protein product, partial [Allacma fusca]
LSIPGNSISSKCSYSKRQSEGQQEKAHDPYALEILKRIAPSRKKMRKAGVPKQKIAALVLSS